MKRHPKRARPLWGRSRQLTGPPRRWTGLTLNFGPGTYVEGPPSPPMTDPIIYRRFPDPDECGTRRGSRWCPLPAIHRGPCGLDLAVVEGRPRYKDSAYFSRPAALAVDQIWRDVRGRTVRLTREEEGRWYADGPCEWIDHARLIDGVEDWDYLGTREDVDARPERPTPSLNRDRVDHFLAAIEEGERRAAAMTEEERERERRWRPIPWTRGNGWGHPS